MTIFKSIDKKFLEIGFIKIYEGKFGATYERWNKQYNYVQVLDLRRKASGMHIIQSFQKKLNSDSLNNMVGISMYETKLSLRKMCQMGWKPLKSK